MIEHPDEGLLHAYVDGELDEVERSRIETHFDDCSHCQRSLAAVQAVFSRLETVDEMPLTTDLSGVVVKRLQDRNPANPKLRWVAAVEVLLAGALLSLIGLTDPGIRILVGIRSPVLRWLGWPQTLLDNLQMVIGELVRAAEVVWAQGLAQWSTLALPGRLPNAPWPLLLGLALTIALLTNGLLLRDGWAPADSLKNGNGANHG